MDILIKNDICMMCGEPITLQRVKAHLIPKRLKPINNVLVFLHRECEEKINNLYVNQQTKSEAAKVSKKALNILKDFKSKIQIMEDRIKDENKESKPIK